MADLLLTRGLITQVDDADLAQVSRWAWHAQVGRHTAYARRNTLVAGKSRSIYLHRFILGEPEGDVDHIDGNGLNNQRHNLRAVTHARNLQNGRHSASGYSLRPDGKWRAYLDHDGRRFGLGAYDTPDEAAQARAAAIALRNGLATPFDVLRFPPVFRRAVFTGLLK